MFAGVINHSLLIDARSRSRLGNERQPLQPIYWPEELNVRRRRRYRQLGRDPPLVYEESDQDRKGLTLRASPHLWSSDDTSLYNGQYRRVGNKTRRNV